MRFLSTIITIILSFSIAYTQNAKIDGVRFGIQVKAEDTNYNATKQLGIYRPYAPPFVYPIKLAKKCDTKPNQKSCPITYETKYRIILGVYKTKELAQKQLNSLKEKNPTLFKNAFVQNIIE